MADPSPTTAQLGALVGRWRTEGRVVGADPVPVVGTDTYEWLPGRHFLVHHVDVTVGDQVVRAIELIGGHDPATGALTATAYGDDGTTTVMQARVDDAGTWTFTGGPDVAAAAYDGDVPPAEGAVRSTLTVAEDGESMAALWERADDGETWRPWMDMRFTRDDPAVHQLRLVVEAPDYDGAVAFYRDAVGLREQAAFADVDSGGHVAIFDAGRATLEIANPAQRAMIDRVEVGRDVSPPLRLAFEVDDTRAATARLVEAGAAVIGEPVETPWRSLNARLAAPAGLQLTLFEELEATEERRRRPGFGTSTTRG